MVRQRAGLTGRVLEQKEKISFRAMYSVRWGERIKAEGGHGQSLYGSGRYMSKSSLLITTRLAYYS